MSTPYPIRRRTLLAIIAAAALGCAASVRPALSTTTEQPLAALWEPPADVASRDLFYGPWGAEHAPDPAAEYTFVRPKSGGFNPGMVVRDPQGREWHVKQSSDHHGAEGPAEVVLSRVLSALGYHQPPVYFLPSFRMRDAKGLHMEDGGRFRLHDPSMTDLGEWSLEKNPFIGQPSFNGLLVIMLAFNSSDLKNSNNTIYRVKGRPGPDEWYVIRDLGDALGRTGKIAPQRNNLEIFSRTRFITGVHDGYVQFDYHGLHQELVAKRITPADVAWGCGLMARLTGRQWEDAFRAGGYTPDTAARFIAILQARVAEGQRVGAGGVASQ